MDPPHLLGMREDKGDGLLSRFCCTPPCAVIVQQYGLNGILGSDFDSTRSSTLSQSPSLGGETFG